MKWLFPFLFLAAVILSLFSGDGGQMTNALLEEISLAIQTMLTLTGAMCFWSGMMHIAKDSGVSKAIGKALTPWIGKLIPKIKGESAESVTLNLSANLLGLGNAATPLGLRAVQCMAAEGLPAESFATFIVMNCCSLQLIPTTVVSLRYQAGSVAPMEILPAVWLCSLLSVVSALFAVRLCYFLFIGRRKK